LNIYVEVCSKENNYLFKKLGEPCCDKAIHSLLTLSVKFRIGTSFFDKNEYQVYFCNSMVSTVCPECGEKYNFIVKERKE